MINWFGWAALALLLAYLALFFLVTHRAAKASGRPVWLLGQASGRDRLGALGFSVACIGTLIAMVAQVSMGASWRVGVKEGATGDLVSDGIFKFSRNPTFVGQFLLLGGVAFSVPSVPTLLAPLLFLWSAVNQVRSEEAQLRKSLGPDYDRYAELVPRWIGFRRNTPS